MHFYYIFCNKNIIVENFLKVISVEMFDTIIFCAWRGTAAWNGGKCRFCG